MATSMSDTIGAAAEKLGADKLGSHREEGALTKAVERQTARVPSLGYLGLAAASIGLSLAFKVRGKDTVANFIGLWVPSILLLGVYNKLVKLEGSDRRS